MPRVAIKKKDYKIRDLKAWICGQMHTGIKTGRCRPEAGDHTAGVIQQIETWRKEQGIRPF